ncbi:MAG: hypothetical protein SVT56_01480 [Chloroflexota bacterium]|nr:hypothetical protein [Chloroflexota bacterium]
MTKRERVVRLVFILLLIVGGWAVFQLLNPGRNIQSPDGFRQWFWHFRGLDLIAQMTLVFAGALAISALLPSEDNND